MRKYGAEWDDSWSEIKIEAHCLAARWDEKYGGLGHYGHLKRFMQLLWPANYTGFRADSKGHKWSNWRDSTERVVRAWCDHSYGSLIGCASSGKTFDLSHILSAEYLADPFNTIIDVTSTDMRGLRARIWSEIANAVHHNAYAPEIDLYEINNPSTLQLSPRPGDCLPDEREEVGRVGVRDDGGVEELAQMLKSGVRKKKRTNARPKEDKYVIRGIPTDDTKAAVEKIQGNHSRKKHYVIVDESQGVAEAIFLVSANLATDPEYKFWQIMNPKDHFSPAGKECKPVDGWDSITADSLEWKPEVHQQSDGTNSGIVLRIDGLQSPNIQAGEVVFPFLTTPKYVAETEASYTKNSVEYWSYVRGFFPPDGILGTIFPASSISRMEESVTFAEPPVRIAAFDPAFEGGDSPAFIVAEYGPEISTKDKNGLQFAMRGLAAFPIQRIIRQDKPLDFCIADEVKRKCTEYGVAPENFIIDSTGAGRGVAAILRTQWGNNINECLFGAKTTERQVIVGDPRPSSEIYDRFVTELWFAARTFADSHHLRGFGMDCFSQMREQLSTREYTLVQNKKQRAETKEEMRKRVHYSPDFGDCLTMLVELLRRKGAVANGFLQYNSVNAEFAKMADAAQEVGKAEGFEMESELDLL